MGGKKKLSLKQIEKSQARSQSRKEGGGAPKSSGGSETKTKAVGIFLPDPKNKKVIGELKKMKALTPYTVASSLDLRLSMAKHFLEELEKQGAVEYVSGSRNLKIYKFTD